MPRRTGATDPTSPKNLTDAQRAAKAVQMRTQGAKFDDIAKACGYYSRSTAHAAVMRAVKAIRTEPAQPDRWRKRPCFLGKGAAPQAAGVLGRLFRRIMQQGPRYGPVYSRGAS